MTETSEITAVILAGGKSRRMDGKDKGLVRLRGKPLISHVISAIKPQVGELLINANRNPEEYATFGYPVISDSLDNFQGPLAGFLAAMQAIDTPYLLSVPCDGPLLAGDLVRRLISARTRSKAEIAVAHDGNRLQPVYALIPKKLQPSLEAYLESGDRKIDRWYEQHKVAHADFSDIPETFININTPQERERLEMRSVVA